MKLAPPSRPAVQYDIILSNRPKLLSTLGSTDDESSLLFRYIAPPSWPAVSCSNILLPMCPPESEYIDPPSFVAML